MVKTRDVTMGVLGNQNTSLDRNFLQFARVFQKKKFHDIPLNVAVHTKKIQNTPFEKFLATPLVRGGIFGIFSKKIQVN